jgi:hypothetical protein
MANTAASSPIVIVLRTIPPNYIPSLRPTFEWLLCPPIQWKPTKPKALLLSLFLFFVRSICRPKQWVNILTTRIALALSPLQCPPPPLPPTYGWLLYSPIEWQPPKAGTLPIAHFLMGDISAPQSRESSVASMNPATRCLQWTHREPRRHDSGSWQILPWRYRAKPLGVGRQQLILFLCVVLCVVCVCKVLHLLIFWVCIR